MKQVNEVRTIESNLMDQSDVLKWRDMALTCGVTYLNFPPVACAPNMEGIGKAYLRKEPDRGYTAFFQVPPITQNGLQILYVALGALERGDDNIYLPGIPSDLCHYQWYVRRLGYHAYPCPPMKEPNGYEIAGWTIKVMTSAQWENERNSNLEKHKTFID